MTMTALQREGETVAVPVEASMNEIWILGATGRSGRAIAAPAGSGARAGPGGAYPTRLRELAGTIGGKPRIVAAGSVDAVVTELAQSTPAVVINTIGPFTETALPIARACPPGTHYVDLANELFAVTGCSDCTMRLSLPAGLW
jgi:short subunit dehydrogenase-like uncharacterized protein